MAPPPDTAVPADLPPDVSPLVEPPRPPPWAEPPAPPCLAEPPVAPSAAAAPNEGREPVPAPPPELPPIDLSPERFEAQDALRWNGRMLSELSDAELAAVAEGLAAMDLPPEQRGMRSQRNWLKLRVTWPQKRVSLRLRVDETVLEWFQRDGTGYQERMNAVLRAYVEAQLEAEARGR